MCNKFLPKVCSATDISRKFTVECILTVFLGVLTAFGADKFGCLSIINKDD
jgi:hypothetical protein